MKKRNLFQAFLGGFALLALGACSTIADTVSAPSQSTSQNEQTIPSPVAITSQSLRAERLDIVMAKLVRNNEIAGLSALVFENGEEVYYNAAGHLDREADIPMSRDAVGRYYSMTKPIVGVGLMMLYEDGKFALDDPIEKYLPEYANMKVYAGQDADGAPLLENAARSITIRDLMRHTSGLTYGFITQTPVDLLYLKSGLLSFEHTNAEFSQKLAKLPLLKEPGQQYIYSFSTDVQGRLIEVLSGQTLGDYLHDHIFTPLGMTHTGFTVKEADREKFGPVYGEHEGALIRLADGMEAVPFEIDAPFLTDKPFESAGSGLVSSLDDYAKFALMLRNQGQPLISSQTHAMMTRDQLGSIDNGWLAADAGFGLNFAVKTKPALEGELPIPVGSYYWGGMAGTYFWVDPKNDLFVVLQMQKIGRSENTIRNRMAQAVYGP